MRARSWIWVMLAAVMLGTGSRGEGAPFIQGQKLDISFDEPYYNIYSITSRESGTVLGGWQTDTNNVLFTLSMRQGTGLLTTLSNESPCQARSYSSSVNGTETTLTLNYYGFSVGGQSGVVDVTVTVRAYSDRPETEWRMAVDNRSGSYGVWEVMFPYVRLSAINGTANDDCLVYSMGAGMLVRNPYDATSRSNQRLWDMLEYPYPLNMQWTALYDEQAGGLYLAAHDPTGHHKQFNFPLMGSNVWFWITHKVGDKGQAGLDYESPYPVIIGYTPGNWYDATQIYRGWALQQVWASGGPLATRADIPQWYKEAPFHLVGYSYGNTINQTRDNILSHQQVLGYRGKIPLIWYMWHTFRPEQTAHDHETAGPHAGHPMPEKDGFAAATALLESEDIYTQPYVNTRVFDIPDFGDPCYPQPGWQENAVRDIYGNYVEWSHADFPGFIDMCRYTSFYQDNITDTCVDLTQNYSCKGAYLDQYPNVSNECFDASHGHPLGGGNWQFYAMRQLMQGVREATRQADGDSVFTGENGAEICMDLMDGMLFHHDLWPHLVPLSMAVYGDYWLPYGRFVRETELGDDVLFRLTISNKFVYGIKLGRISTESTAKLYGLPYAENLALLKKLIQYRVAAKTYLVYGRMRRPLRFANQIPVINYMMEGTWPVEQPVLMSSVWEGLDGTTGVILFNIGPQEQAYEFTLSAADYPVLAGGPVDIYRFLRPDGAKLYLGQVETSDYVMSGELEPDEVRIFVLALAGLGGDCAGKWQLGLGSAMDLNQDCQVDLADFSGFMVEWLSCNNPQDFDCF